jgi:hypothetical protein
MTFAETILCGLLIGFVALVMGCGVAVPWIRKEKEEKVVKRPRKNLAA